MGSLPHSHSHPYTATASDGAELKVVIDLDKKGNEAVINFYSNRKTENGGQRPHPVSQTASSSGGSIANSADGAQGGKLLFSKGRKPVVTREEDAAYADAVNIRNPTLAHESPKGEALEALKAQTSARSRTTGKIIPNSADGAQGGDRKLLFSRAVAPSKLGDGKQRYYEVPFDKAVDKIVANHRKNGAKAQALSNDYVFVGETPNALEEIGFVKLPVMMTQHHIETCYFDKAKGKAWGIGGNMHGLGNALKRVPAAIKSPVMVIASKSPKGKDTSVVAITSVSTPDGDMILPIVINGEPNINGERLTAHVLTSAHGRKNAWSGLIADAIKAEDNGDVGIFYIDKAKASKVFTKLAQANPQLARAGLKYAKTPQSNGVLHSVSDPGSPVKGQAGIGGSPIFSSLARRCGGLRGFEPILRKDWRFPIF